MVVIIEPIVPERLIRSRIPERAYDAIVDAVKDEIQEMEKMFGQGTRTWSSSSQPSWELRVKPGFAVAGTVTTGDTPFIYVEVGTRYRWRRMTRDFQAKTTPGVLGSGPGRGGVAGWFRRPAKGITGRGFRDIIVAKRAGPFQRRIERALINATRP